MHTQAMTQGKITRDSLMTLETYAKERPHFRTRVLAHKRARTVHLGEHLTLIFEDELDAYNPLVPDGSNFKASLMIEYEDVDERRRALSRLRGIEDRVWVRVGGFDRVYAIADEDLDRENAEKTSAVHFVRFEFSAAQREAIRAGAGVKIGCDHTNYPAHTAVAAETLASLAGDLRGG